MTFNEHLLFVKRYSKWLTQTLHTIYTQLKKTIRSEWENYRKITCTFDFNYTPLNDTHEQEDKHQCNILTVWCKYCDCITWIFTINSINFHWKCKNYNCHMRHIKESWNLSIIILSINNVNRRIYLEEKILSKKKKQISEIKYLESCFYILIDLTITNYFSC